MNIRYYITPFAIQHSTIIKYISEKVLIIKPTRCTNFLNLFLEWNSTCFGQFLCPSSGVFHCTHSNDIYHTGFLTACEQDKDGTAVTAWYCSQAVSKPVWHILLLCIQWKTPDDGQRNCLKHVEFYSKTKTFERLVHLVGFIIRNLSRCTATWTSNKKVSQTKRMDLHVCLPSRARVVSSHVYFPLCSTISNSGSLYQHFWSSTLPKPCSHPFGDEKGLIHWNQWWQ